MLLTREEMTFDFGGKKLDPKADKEILTPPWLRANMPRAWEQEFLDNYRKAQDVIEQHQAIEDRRWTGPAK